MLFQEGKIERARKPTNAPPTSTPRAFPILSSSHERRDSNVARGTSNDRNFGGGDGEEPPPNVVLERSHIVDSSKSKSSK